MKQIDFLGGFPKNEKVSRLGSHWIGAVDLGKIASHAGTPVFIYSAEQLTKNLRRVKAAAREAGLGDRLSIFVPFFPNANPHLLKPLQDEHVGILLQMPNEHEITTRFGYSNFIVSPGHVSNEEISFWGQHGHPTFLASLDEIGFALEQRAATVSVRIDSLGSDKPGIKVDQLADLVRLLEAHNRTLECFEVYCGSGNSLDDMVDIVRQIFRIFLDYFPSAKSINFAGGHGFNYEGWDDRLKHFDWRVYFKAIRSLAAEMGIPDTVTFLIEPARDILADTGVLLVGVKRDIIDNSNGSIVVTDGSRMLMPSAQLRNRVHNTVFLDHRFREIEVDTVVNCKIRGRSLLRNDYILPGEAQVPRSIAAGGHLLIFDVGAYCATQHMEFLNVPPAGEVVVDTDGSVHLVTKPGDALDKWRNLLPLNQPVQVC